MYRWERSLTEDKMKKNQTIPSFSSTLLDEIYRSTDAGEGKREEVKMYRERTAKKQSSAGGVRGMTGRNENTEKASLRRASLIEKWMEKKANEKAKESNRREQLRVPEIAGKSLHHSDPLFFSPTSTSSDSSFGGFSSSETENFGAAPPKPKSIRTSVSAPRSSKSENSMAYKQSESHLFDEFPQRNHQTNEKEDGLIKSKARAAKIYANLKKMKQPISPGGRLTSFLNSLFSNNNAKKTKNTRSRTGDVSDGFPERESKSAQPSVCSSASSFSRSCLSRNATHNSKEKSSNGVQRTVRFYPVSVIVDEDCRPCGHKCIYNQGSDQFGRPPLPTRTEPKLQHSEKYRKINDPKPYRNQTKNHFEEDEDDDFGSDSSSDLFEIDHLDLFQNGRFSEELPVYESTHLPSSRRIGSGLIV